MTRYRPPAAPAPNTSRRKARAAAQGVGASCGAWSGRASRRPCPRPQRRATARRTRNTPTARAAARDRLGACDSCASGWTAWSVVDQPPQRSAAGVFRRLGDARNDDGARHALSHRRAGRVRHGAPATSAWIRRSARALMSKGLDDEVKSSRRAAATHRSHAALRDRRPCEYEPAPTLQTRTFLNCHGSLLSTSSGNSRSRSCSGVQSV